MKLTKLPDNVAILYALALAQTMGIASALITYESGAGLFAMILAALRGILLGASISFGMAVAAQHLPRAAKKAQGLGYAALAGLMIVSPIIMSPAIMTALPASIRAILTPALQWVLSISIATAPDLVAVAVAAQSGALQSQTAQSQTAQVQSPTALAQGAPKVRRTKSQSAVQSDRVPCEEPGCNMDYAVKGGKGGHYKIYHPRPVEIDQALLIRKGEK